MQQLVDTSRQGSLRLQDVPEVLQKWLYSEADRRNRATTESESSSLNESGRSLESCESLANGDQKASVSSSSSAGGQVGAKTPGPVFDFLGVLYRCCKLSVACLYLSETICALIIPALISKLPDVPHLSKTCRLLFSLRHT
jgi:hypothetical protein